MKPLRPGIVVTLGVAAALGMSLGARPAAADVDRGASPVVLQVAARPAHTDATPCLSVRTGHALHLRHHRHGGRHAGRMAGATTTRREPLSPPRPHPEHRAALPRVGTGTRTHGGSRDGQRAIATLPGLPALLTLEAGSFDADQNASFARMRGFVHSGRGPPRAGPFTSLPPSFAGGLPLLLPSTALLLPLQSGSSDAPRSHGVFRAAPGWTAAACSYRFTRSEEPLQRCSHACRPEGAAVCCLMPSVGGFS